MGSARNARTERPAATRRRKELVEAASRVFQAKGYEGASVQEIADQLGLLKGSLYHWIDSKEDLLYWTIKQGHERFTPVADAARNKSVPSIDRLRQFILAHTVTIASDVTNTAVFFRDFGHLAGRRRNEILRFRERYMSTLVDLLADAQHDEVIRSDFSPTQIAIAILGMLNWTYTWYRLTGPSTPEQIGNLYWRLIIDGLGVPLRGKRRRLT